MQNQKQSVSKTIYRDKYEPLKFVIKHTSLYFSIKSLSEVSVHSSLKIISKNEDEAKNSPLILNGSDFLTTKKVNINGIDLKENVDYSINSGLLTIFNPPKQQIILNIEVLINPSNNTDLSGLYKTQNKLSTQCEPEGFRNITWFIDRPDNMGVWDVSIEADIQQFPVTLSNGNLISETMITSSRMVRVFQDPFNKPSYLFGLVAGDFDCLSDAYTTKASGKLVKLAIYVDKGKVDEAKFAMQCLKKSMMWDEKTFNLEYDLDIFNIVAVKDFNFGAMENKSLNIFNEEVILAKTELITDNEALYIEKVIAHEYFHNWSGNRVTCRDWFQLTLKEGLTVFRDHLFSQDENYHGCERVKEVDSLKRVQFKEDASPLRHPIRPNSFIEIDNFYTSTVYNKGAEVIKMIQTFLGKEKFTKAVKFYFDKFDGQAVTCDDFLWAMSYSSELPLDNFKKWYSNSGTPVIKVVTKYNENNNEFSINFKRLNSDKEGDNKLPDLKDIPLRIALLNDDTKCNETGLITSRDIFLDEIESVVTFNNINKMPVLSVNRDFAAPIIVDYSQSESNLRTIINYESDDVARVDASRKYFSKYILETTDDLVREKNLMKINGDEAFDFLKNVLLSNDNNYLKAMLLSTPGYSIISNNFNKDIPVNHIYKAVDYISLSLAKTLEHTLLKVYETLKENPNSFNKEDYASRALKNTILAYLVKLEKKEYFLLAKDHYYKTPNMTNRIGALQAINNINNVIREELFQEFMYQYKNEDIAINKFITLELAAYDDKYTALKKAKSFINNQELFEWTNPNKVRSVIGSLCFINKFVFHKADGESYRFIADAVVKLDDINQMVASSIATSFAEAAYFSLDRQKLMIEAMNTIIVKKNLSKGVYEIISKILTEVKGV